MWWLLACAADSPTPVGTGAPVDSGAGETSAPPVDSGDGAPPPPPGAVVLQGGTVVDREGVRAGVDVLLADGRVWDVRPTGGTYGDAEVWDAAGRWVVPGLVDAHVHLAHSGATVWTGDPLDANLRAQLYHGVLAVYDVGGPDVILAARDAVEAGSLLGPHIRATGPFLTAVGSHPCERWPDPDLCVFVGPDDAAAAAAGRAAAGADAVKVALADAAFTPWPTPRLDLEALAAITAGPLPVIAHVDTDTDVVDAVDAGVSFLAHPPFSGPIGPDAVAAATRAEGVFSTVGAFAAVGDVLDGVTDLDDPGLLLGPGVSENWAFVRAHPDVLEPGWADASAAWAVDARANLGELARAGAVVLPGSDAGYYFVPHGVGLHRELAELVAGGWTPFEALVAATATARQVLGFEGGTVVPGAPADLLVLRTDPTVDVGALDDIETVVLGGVAWPRETLRTADLQSAGDAPCLEDADCGTGERCDGVDHRCAEACAPTYDYAGSCDPLTWCMPKDGVDAVEGACHEEGPCDLYAQDCAPAAYGQACVPLDVDTNTCWYGGPGQVGDSCSWDDADSACAPGLYCSVLTGTCYQLCDPEAVDTCPGRQVCVQQEAERGVPWFGLCL